MQPWQRYLHLLRERMGDPARHMEPGPAVEQAAHAAYRATADHLSAQEGWSDDRVLRLTRGFNEDVRQWRDGGRWDWAELEALLRAREAEAG